ncbi:Retrotransposon gag protein [Quillaja saponaria]|uniref:Retrotransposon gag protein n=1 Tax=Quillaja saponaria TaxID=32244 RepID=A0AAD7VE74_QUISA|nr:Retrotransposon gag protein [Quillaja saponaria]
MVNVSSTVLDQRFEALDARIDGINTRISEMDGRFSNVEASFWDLKMSNATAMELLNQSIETKFEAFLEKFLHTMQPSMEDARRTSQAQPSTSDVQHEANPPILPIPPLQSTPLRFDGINFKSWFLKCQQLLKVAYMPEELKIKVVSMHFGEKAWEWHESFLGEKHGETITWEEYVQEMREKFQGGVLTRPMIALKNLRQMGTIDDYNDDFEILKNQCSMAKELLLDHYLGGLKEEILH